MPDSRITIIDFTNRNPELKTIWVEPLGEPIEIDSETEYGITAKENEFYIEFYPNHIVLYLQHPVGFLLHKRPLSQELSNPNQWILAVDYQF